MNGKIPEFPNSDLPPGYRHLYMGQGKPTNHAFYLPQSLPFFHHQFDSTNYCSWEITKKLGPLTQELFGSHKTPGKAALMLPKIQTHTFQQQSSQYIFEKIITVLSHNCGVSAYRSVLLVKRKRRNGGGCRVVLYDISFISLFLSCFF